MRNALLNIILLFISSLMILSAVPAYAATIHGTIYDLSLDSIDALVEINSLPQQFYVAVNGTYEFNINPGIYELKVNSSDGSATEHIEIVEEGDYVIDIVIGLDIDEPIIFEDDQTVTDVSTDINGSSINNALIGVIIIVLLAAIIIILLITRTSSQKQKGKTHNDNANTANNVNTVNTNAVAAAKDIEISDLAEHVMTIIRQNSRITQKELRKMLPYSEAKISLIVAELEHDGHIKKIKKGRGNILVYVK